METEKIVSFRDWFTRQGPRLRRLERERAFAEIQTRVAAIDRQLTVEMNLDPKIPELIVSANGRRALFDAARAIATDMDDSGWLVVPLKQPRGFNFAIDIAGASIVAAGLRFNALRHRRDPRKIGICVGVISGIEKQKAIDLAKIIIDTGVGEEMAAELNFVDTVDHEPAHFSSWLPMAALPQYLHLKDSGRATEPN